MSAQPVPTLEQRRALAAYLAAQRETETSRGWNDYMREQTYRAERHTPTHKMEMDLPVPSVWQLIREEYRENPDALLVAGLIWLAVLGIGLVLLAVRQGWVS
jgi:hypothetical protein